MDEWPTGSELKRHVLNEPPDAEMSMTVYENERATAEREFWDKRLREATRTVTMTTQHDGYFPNDQPVGWSMLETSVVVCGYEFIIPAGDYDNFEDIVAATNRRAGFEAFSLGPDGSMNNWKYDAELIERECGFRRGLLMKRFERVTEVRQTQ
jgi:hypothetical protein